MPKIDVKMLPSILGLKFTAASNCALFCANWIFFMPNYFIFSL